MKDDKVLPETIPVIFKSFKKEVPDRGYWDYAMIEEIFSGELWDCVDSYEFDTKFNEDDPHKGAVLVIPARSHTDKLPEINEYIKPLEWVVITLMGDEDGAFPVEELEHPNMKIWLMLPHHFKHTKVDRYLVNGYPPGLRKFVKEIKPEAALNRERNWFFSGQVTHKRRTSCVKALKETSKENIGQLKVSTGFTLGIPQKDYWKKMLSAKVAPCPSGAIIPDSFRFYEALECGCVPIADSKSPVKNIEYFWNNLLNCDELPFPVIKKWTAVDGTIQYHADVWPRSANRASAWWQLFKRKMAYDLHDDIRAVSGEYNHANYLRDQLTVIVPTSPIEKHPDTSVIEETISTIRERLPDSEIIVMFDGVREEQEHLRQKYEEYIYKMLWMFNTKYKNIVPLVFNEHTHQAGMTREALKLVKTPGVLFVEHDTPLCEEIPFPKIVEVVLSGKLNVVRLNHEAIVLDAHKHLALDKDPIDISGLPVVRTGQWSQRPHVARTDFYRRLIENHFSVKSLTMIEDRILGRVQDAWLYRGKAGWNEWKVAIYAPEGDMKRSYHIDGRGKTPKFEDKFKY